MIKKFVKKALEEDVGRGDLFALVGKDSFASANIICKDEGVFAGYTYVKALCKLCKLDITFYVKDGSVLHKGDVVALIEGKSKNILRAERVMLNLMQHASGIATNVASYKKVLEGYSMKLLDTRKTRPHLRIFEKYAIRCGGGNNHRMGLDDCLMIKDTHLKTIIHIPNVNAIAAVTDKYETVRKIIGYIGETVNVDTATGILTVKTNDGRLLKVADLVNDDATRVKTQDYLANINDRDDMDIIIALGMAKEGFDWVYCEHVLTIGYRGSMTEVIQIIGRATRDVAGKTHAQFTNLIAMPEASQAEVTNAVNDMLKAISLSLLMEQVLAPNVNFKPRSEVKPDEVLPIGTIIIEDNVNPPSKRALQILNQDSNEIIAEISQNTQLAKQYIQATPEFKNGLDADEQAELISDTVLPTMLRIRYPYLDDDEIGQVQQGVMTKLLINNSGGVVEINQIPDDAEIEGERQFTQQNGKYIDITHLPAAQRESLDPVNIVKERHLPYNVTIFDPTTNQDSQRTTNTTNEQFVKIGKKFINVADLPINLINAVNPFQRGYEVLSKNLDSQALHTINEVVLATRSTMTEQEAFGLWERINDFIARTGNEPNRNSNDPQEVRMAEALNFIRIKVAEQRNSQSNSEAQNNG